MRISDWSSDVCSSDLTRRSASPLTPEYYSGIFEGRADILRISRTDTHLEVFMFKSLLPSAAAAFALLITPVAASAHTKLVSSTPAANSTVSKVPSVNLQFNEKIVASTTDRKSTRLNSSN